jgi:hypothetical protein
VSYCAYDANGYLGDLASNGGWATFVKWAQLQSGPVRALVEEGITDSPAELAAALTDGPAPPSDVEEVWVGLKEFAGRADEVLIVTDGLGFEDEPATGPEVVPTPEAPSRFADWTKDNVTIMDREGYVVEVGPDGEWRRKQPPTEESVTGPDVVPSPDIPSRFADWTKDNVTWRDAEGYVLDISNGEWRRKVPWTKEG